MKRISFNRRSLLRAIHAACIALFLAATAQRAEAQMFSPPFQVNGSVVTTSSGSYGNGAGLYEPGADYSSVTIGGGTMINSALSYAASDGLNQALIQTSASSFSNAGTVSLATTNSGAYQAAVYLDQGALSLTASNSGTISATSGGSTNVALDITSTSGNLSFTNSGSVYSNGSNGNNGLTVNSSAGGNITINNNQGGTIAIGPTSPGEIIQAATTGPGTITVNNAGTISADAGNYASEGIQASADAGMIQITNSGTVTNVQNGINTSANTGNVTVTNSGNINASGYGVEAEAYAPTALLTITNSGTITGVTSSGLYASAQNLVVRNGGSISGTGSGSYIYQYGAPGTVQFLNTGSITVSGDGVDIHSDPSTPIMVNNSGTINSGGTGVMLYNPGVVTDSGPITGATAAINVPSGSSVTLSGRPIINGAIIGGATSASTSTLAFNLSVPAANLAAAQTQLNTELVAYAAQLGGNYTFTIDGLTYDISNFDLNGITDDLTVPPPTRMFAETPGYQSMGTVLDNLNTNNAQASKLLTALGNVPDAGVVNALGELSPKALEIFSNVADNVATFNAAKINNHLANRRDGLTGFDATALNVQDSSMDPSLNQVRDHLLAYNPAATPGLMSDTVDSLFGGMDMKNTQVNTMPADRWSSFIAGDVILADLSHNANLEDADYTTGNVTAGVDYRLDDHFTVGGLFAYSHTDADLDSRGSSATVDSYSPGIYASYVDKGWYGNGLATYGRNAYTSDRRVDIPGLAGDNHGGTSGNQGTINLTGGYEFQRGAFKFGPVASAQYVHLSIDSMQEEGPTALSIEAQDQDSFRSQLGVEGRFVADINTPVGPMTLTPHVSASWQHEYLDSSRGINAQFSGTGGGSFVTQTDNPDRDAAFIDVGLDATVSKNVTVFVDYETQAGQNNYFAQSAEGGVKIGF